MLAYKLDKNIPMEKLTSDINKLLESCGQDRTNMVLVISVKSIDTETTNLIPKIEHHE